jgi:hypothetical protein
MIASNKFNVFLCLAVFTFTALSEEQSFLSDHVTGFQAVTAQCHGNTSDDLDLYVLKPAKQISQEYCQKRYFFYHSNQKYFNHSTRSARAPPLI